MGEETAERGSRRRAEIRLGGRSLREHAARGTMINAAFSVGLAGIGVARRFLIAIFLTAADYGVWGLIFGAVTMILWLKEIGIGDKFIQQDEGNQEEAFHKAFTLNLVWTIFFWLLILIAVPVLAQVYGRPEIILPGCVMSLAILASAFQAPGWILYRQMRFALQRALQAIDPVVALVVTLGLGIAGAGYWSLVGGVLAGSFTSAAAMVIASPYPLRLRWESGALKDYFSFSWPLLLAGGSGMIMVQTALIVGEATVGLAGVGAIGLAGTIAAFADRVDHIITSTLYPAVCAVRDRKDLLLESFTKSNRLALVWSVPFGLGLALFAEDIVTYILGEKWDVATGLLQVFGLTAAIKQLGFNWTAYHRAVGDTRPIAVNGAISLVVFVAVCIPGMILWGLNGYALAIAVMTVVQLAIRAYFLRRLFDGFQFLQHTGRALAPCLPAAALILAVRQLESGERSPGVVLAELALFTATTVAVTWAAERDLLREMFGYMRGATRATPVAG